MKVKTGDVLGYVYDPTVLGAPYVALILCPDSEPIVSLHQSRAEAEHAVVLELAVIRHNLAVDGQSGGA